MSDEMKLEITRATVVFDNIPIHTYENVCDRVDADELAAYKEKVKARFRNDVSRMDVDLVYKEIDE